MQRSDRSKREVEAVWPWRTFSGCECRTFLRKSTELSDKSKKRSLSGDLGDGSTETEAEAAAAVAGAVAIAIGRPQEAGIAAPAAPA